MTDHQQKPATAAEVLQRYMDAYPAFRIKPKGEPGSPVRIEQENLMALEDAARDALAAQPSTAGISPSDYEIEHILQFFEYKHLPEKLQAVSKPFGDLAGVIVAGLLRNPERTVALRKLLEAKDAAVRAAVAR